MQTTPPSQALILAAADELARELEETDLEEDGLDLVEKAIALLRQIGGRRPWEAHESIERDEKDGTVVLTLRKPIAAGSDYITELRFRELTAGQMRDIGKRDANLGGTLKLAERSTKTMGPHLNQLGTEDTARVIDIMGWLTAPFLGT